MGLLTGCLSLNVMEALIRLYHCSLDGCIGDIPKPPKFYRMCSYVSVRLHKHVYGYCIVELKFDFFVDHIDHKVLRKSRVFNGKYFFCLSKFEPMLIRFSHVDKVFEDVIDKELEDLEDDDPFDDDI